MRAKVKSVHTRAVFVCHEPILHSGGQGRLRGDKVREADVFRLFWCAAHPAVFFHAALEEDQLLLAAGIRGWDGTLGGLQHLGHVVLKVVGDVVTVAAMQ